MGIFQNDGTPASTQVTDFFTSTAPVTGELEVPVAPRATKAGTPESLAELGMAGLEPVTSITSPEAGTIAWLSSTPVDLARWWPRLVEAFPRSGWWPMIVPVENQMLDFVRDGELDGPVELPADSWSVPGCELAVGSHPEEVVTIQYPVREHLLLVPVTRPADVLAAIGWNVLNDGSLDIARLTLALRSWEERFGAVVGEMGPASLMVDVTAPPQDRAQQRLLLAELEALCPDIFVDAEEEDMLEFAASGPWMLWWE